MSVSQAVERIRQAATRKPQEKLTALLHHITTDALRCAFYDLKKTASAGVDGLVWTGYEDGLEERLLDLHGRVHSGAYRALPSRRVEIPKPDGGTRPLGIAALEDKIVQKAVVDVILTPLYEPEFLGFSYGFRAGRGAHDALDALAFGTERRKVNWIIDADIRAFFDRLSRDHLLRFLEHRIGDKRVLRLIAKWLNAGVMEDDEWKDDLGGEQRQQALHVRSFAVPGGQPMNGEGVSQIMQARLVARFWFPAHPGRPSQMDEGFAHGSGGQRRAVAVYEERRFARLGSAGRFALSSVSLQRPCELRPEGHEAGLVELRLAHGEHRGLQVDIGQREVERLPATQAGAVQHEEQRPGRCAAPTG